MVSARVYPNQISVVAHDTLVASHARSTIRGQVCYDWQHYLALVECKPRALRNGAPSADLPEPLKRLRLGLLRHAGGDQIMAQVLAAVPTAGLAAVLVAVELVVESGVLSTEHVLNVLARLNAAPVPACVQTPCGSRRRRWPIRHYDSLRDIEAATATVVGAGHA